MGLAQLICAILPFVCPKSQPANLQWGPCDKSLAIVPSLSCGFFEVPMDYHNRSAGTAKLALIKANATGERRGTVFMNPGGPGVSGIGALNETSSLLLNQTGGVYDIVSWDPRGVGSLTFPGDALCFDNADEQKAFFNGTIEVNGIQHTGNFTNPDDVHTLLSEASIMQEKYNELGQRCLQHPNGKYLQYVGTTATVRDLVAMADALDGPGKPINYIGLSYGTILGSWFINMFPERVGRVVLDGVVDPVGFSTEDISLAWAQQLVDADSVYKAFFTGCALAGPDACPIASAGQSPLEVNGNIQIILNMAYDAFQANPLVPVTSGQIRSLLRDIMYVPAVWQGFVASTVPGFVQGIQAEFAQPGAAPSRRDFASQIKRQSAAPSTPYSTEAIICGDVASDMGTNMTTVLEGIISTSQNVSHMFGAAWPFATYYCPFWPVRAVERYTGPFNKTLAGPIIVIGNTFDPATPFAGANAVADELGADQATLVRMNGFGHTSQAESSVCISDIIRAYMVNGTRPSGDATVCEVDGDFQVFTGVNTSAILANMPAGGF